MQTAPKKVINGWAMYDWANSVYNLVITSTIFPAYYEAVTGDGNDHTIVDKIKIGNYEFSNTALYRSYFSLYRFDVGVFSSILTDIVSWQSSRR